MRSRFCFCYNKAAEHYACIDNNTATAHIYIICQKQCDTDNIYII